MKTPHIHIAIPVLNESLFLPDTLACIAQQDYRSFTVYICVNQPQAWVNGTAEQQAKYEDNQATLAWLNTPQDLPLVVLDYSSPEKGWSTQKMGVGWARKVLMDTIAEKASDTDILVSLDADTTFGPAYLSAVVDILSKSPKAVALANPYYHLLTADEQVDRAVLRYEIYMRHYAIQLSRIQSPYAFTALGSAMALPMVTYKKIGGMTPKSSGEDFYLLQKCQKYGQVLTYNHQLVYPKARFSDRVFFGTGPAMIKGSQGNWESYPIYHHSLFDELEYLYTLFPLLYERTVPTPLDAFIQAQFKEVDSWAALRYNYPNKTQFVRACHTKIDGLRILQYLKGQQPLLHKSDESCLKEAYPSMDILQESSFSFSTVSIDRLQDIRHHLFTIEQNAQKKAYDDFHSGGYGFR